MAQPVVRALLNALPCPECEAPAPHRVFEEHEVSGLVVFRLARCTDACGRWEALEGGTLEVGRLAQ